MARHRVAILIPAYNEEKTITKIINETKKYGKIIVIDDGSNDKTAYLSKKSGALVESHSKNFGYDAALNTGFKKAYSLGYHHIITIDADGQHNTKFINEFIDLLDSGFGVVVGIRDKKNRFTEYLFGYYTKYKYSINDPLCGFKGYNLKNYKLFGFFDSYKSIGTELMLKSIVAGSSFAQIPISTTKRKDKTKFGNFFIGNFKILRSLLLCFFKINRNNILNI